MAYLPSIEAAQKHVPADLDAESRQRIAGPSSLAILCPRPPLVFWNLGLRVWQPADSAAWHECHGKCGQCGQCTVRSNPDSCGAANIAIAPSKWSSTTSINFERRVTASRFSHIPLHHDSARAIPYSQSVEQGHGYDRDVTRSGPGGRSRADESRRAGGKSGLHRTRWWVTPTGRKARESATESIPPRGVAALRADTPRGKGEKVR